MCSSCLLWFNKKKDCFLYVIPNKDSCRKLECFQKKFSYFHIATKIKKILLGMIKSVPWFLWYDRYCRFSSSI